MADKKITASTTEAFNTIKSGISDNAVKLKNIVVSSIRTSKDDSRTSTIPRNAKKLVDRSNKTDDMVKILDAANLPKIVCQPKDKITSSSHVINHITDTKSKNNTETISHRIKSFLKSTKETLIHSIRSFTRLIRNIFNNIIKNNHNNGSDLPQDHSTDSNISSKKPHSKIKVKIKPQLTKKELLERERNEIQSNLKEQSNSLVESLKKKLSEKTVNISLDSDILKLIVDCYDTTYSLRYQLLEKENKILELDIDTTSEPNDRQSIGPKINLKKNNKIHLSSKTKKTIEGILENLDEPIKTQLKEDIFSKQKLINLTEKIAWIAKDTDKKAKDIKTEDIKSEDIKSEDIKSVDIKEVDIIKLLPLIGLLLKQLHPEDSPISNFLTSMKDADIKSNSPSYMRIDTLNKNFERYITETKRDLPEPKPETETVPSPSKSRVLNVLGKFLPNAKRNHEPELIEKRYITSTPSQAEQVFLKSLLIKHTDEQS